MTAAGRRRRFRTLPHSGKPTMWTSRLRARPETCGAEASAAGPLSWLGTCFGRKGWRPCIWKWSRPTRRLSGCIASWVHQPEHADTEPLGEENAAAGHGDHRRTGLPHLPAQQRLKKIKFFDWKNVRLKTIGLQAVYNNLIFFHPFFPREKGVKVYKPTKPRLDKMK